MHGSMNIKFINNFFVLTSSTDPFKHFRIRVVKSLVPKEKSAIRD
jgi:hypothetical protein